ncbi:MAG: PEP/pyruvate-binding domain-containing protein [Thermodesulfobacteriota bacterium]
MLTLGTKVDTLVQLRKLGFNVPDLVSFTFGQWRNSPREMLSLIREKLGTGRRLAVRSSSAMEDGEDSSMAGCFQSVLDVDCADEESLAEAVERVAAYYGGSPRDQVIAQAMVWDIEACGVVMTRCLDDGSPY